MSSQGMSEMNEGRFHFLEDGGYLSTPFVGMNEARIRNVRCRLLFLGGIGGVYMDRDSGSVNLNGQTSLVLPSFDSSSRGKRCLEEINCWEKRA